MESSTNGGRRTPRSLRSPKDEIGDQRWDQNARQDLDCSISRGSTGPYRNWTELDSNSWSSPRSSTEFRGWISSELANYAATTVKREANPEDGLCCLDSHHFLCERCEP